MTEKGPAGTAFQAAADISFPRLAGTAGEAAAREKVKNLFSEQGLDTKEEWFGCSDYPIRVAARWLLAPSAIILFIAALFLKAQAEAAALFFTGLSLVPPCLLLRRTGQIFKREGAESIKCANVVGRKTSEESAMSVVLVAHYDSKSQRLPIWLRIALYLAGAVGGGIVIALLVAGSLLSVFSLDCPFCNAVLPVSALFLFVSLALLLNTTGNDSDGALDNASGVGIMTAVAEKLRQEDGPPVDLWVVATAAEEIGLWGARAFVKEHEQELPPEKTVVLNFDGCGANRKIGVLKSFGLPPRSAPPELIDKTKSIAALNSLPLKLYRIPLGMSTDLAPFRKAGHKGMDFISPATKSHTQQDRINRLNVSALDDYVTVSTELIKSLAKDQQK